MQKSRNHFLQKHKLTFIFKVLRAQVGYLLSPEKRCTWAEKPGPDAAWRHNNSSIITMRRKSNSEKGKFDNMAKEVGRSKRKAMP